MIRSMSAMLLLCVMLLPGASVWGDGALSFVGANDRVAVSYHASFPTATFTVTAWIKLDVPGHRSAIVARGEDDDSWNLSWQLYVYNGGTFEIMLENQNEQDFCYPNTCMGQPQGSCTSGDLFVADDDWHHMAATRDVAGTLRIFVDGVPQAECSNTGLPSPNNFQDLTIGCTHGTIGPPATTAFSVRTHLRTTPTRIGSSSPTTASLISVATARWTPQMWPFCWITRVHATAARWISTTPAKSVRSISRLSSAHGGRVHKCRATSTWRSETTTNPTHPATPARPAIERRLYLAGLRLATLLNVIFDEAKELPF